MRKRSPFFDKDRGIKTTDKPTQSNGNIIQEKVIRDDGEVTYK